MPPRVADGLSFYHSLGFRKTFLSPLTAGLPGLGGTRTVPLLLRVLHSQSFLNQNCNQERSKERKASHGHLRNCLLIISTKAPVLPSMQQRREASTQRVLKWCCSILFVSPGIKYLLWNKFLYSRKTLKPARHLKVKQGNTDGW